MKLPSLTFVILSLIAIPVAMAQVPVVPSSPSAPSKTSDLPPPDAKLPKAEPTPIQAALAKLAADLGVYERATAASVGATAALEVAKANKATIATMAADSALAIAADQAEIAKLINPQPVPPGPNPPSPVPPTPVTSNLRVLFTYDPVTMLSPAQANIFGSTAIRDYLGRHCPLECPTGMCPLVAATPKTPSFRFLPLGILDTAKLEPVWQAMYRTQSQHTGPWLSATNEAGQVVIDQAWPASVEDTLALLQKFGGK